MGEVLARQFWLYGWGQRMARLAPQGDHASWALVLLGLAIEAEEPSGLVQVDVARLAPRAGLAPQVVDVVLQRLRGLGVLEPRGDLERVDPTRTAGVPLPPQHERYFAREREAFAQGRPDEFRASEEPPAP
jgi:hypothetical protein